MEIRKNQINYKIEVLQIPKNRLGAKLVPLHIKDITDKEQYEILKMRMLSQDYYRQKGEGRPTKKDRRDMSDFLDNDNEEEDDWDAFFLDIDDEEDEE